MFVRKGVTFLYDVENGIIELVLLQMEIKMQFKMLFIIWVIRRKILNLNIIKGNYEYLKDCEEALLQSTLGDEYFENEGSTREAIEEGLAHDSLYVAIIQGQCAGFMFYITNGAFHSFPYLHLIAVKKEYRGKGIGKQLVKYFEEVSEGDKFFLVVADFNPKAKQFYKSIGYRQVGVIPGLYRDGITEYVMMKEK